MRTGHCVSNHSQNIEAQDTHCSVYGFRNGCVDTHPWPTRYSLLLHISLHKDLSQSLMRGVEREAGKKKKKKKWSTHYIVGLVIKIWTAIGIRMCPHTE